MANSLRDGLGRYLLPEQLDRLRAARVGLAGAGGLGSNAALMLARCGIEDMLLLDHDVVEPSNLNRQQYWPRHLGRPKVEALAELLRELNPDMRVEARRLRLCPANLPDILPACPIWVEALDDAEAKTMLVEHALLGGHGRLRGPGHAETPPGASDPGGGFQHRRPHRAAPGPARDRSRRPAGRRRAGVCAGSGRIGQGGTDL